MLVFYMFLVVSLFFSFSSAAHADCSTEQLQKLEVDLEHHLECKNGLLAKIGNGQHFTVQDVCECAGKLNGEEMKKVPNCKIPKTAANYDSDLKHYEHPIKKIFEDCPRTIGVGSSAANGNMMEGEETMMDDDDNIAIQQGSELSSKIACDRQKSKSCGLKACDTRKYGNGTPVCYGYGNGYGRWGFRPCQTTCSSHSCWKSISCVSTPPPRCFFSCKKTFASGSVIGVGIAGITGLAFGVFKFVRNRNNMNDVDDSVYESLNDHV